MNGETNKIRRILSSLQETYILSCWSMEGPSAITMRKHCRTSGCRFFRAFRQSSARLSEPVIHTAQVYLSDMLVYGLSPDIESSPCVCRILSEDFTVFILCCVLLTAGTFSARTCLSKGS